MPVCGSTWAIGATERLETSPAALTRITRLSTRLLYGVACACCKGAARFIWLYCKWRGKAEELQLEAFRSGQVPFAEVHLQVLLSLRELASHQDPLLERNTCSRRLVEPGR